MEVMRSKSAFITMTFSVLGVVLYVTFFSSILTGMTTILTYANISTFTLLQTVVKIAPTILLLGGLFAGGFFYKEGLNSAEAQDANGLMRMVFGVLVIVLFVSLFYTILTSMYTLYTATNASSYTAFQTVVQIAPAILFLGGIFGGVETIRRGRKARKRSRAAAVTY